MKGILNKNRRLFLRSLWIINLRWVAIASVLIATVTLKYAYNASLTDFPIYLVCIFLILENIISLSLLKQIDKNKPTNQDEEQIEAIESINYKKIKRINNIQVFIDLITLTIILYFTGGVENPFIYFYYFHIAIASVLLSQKETYFYASIAILLFLCLTYSAYFEILPYHELNLSAGSSINKLYLDDVFVIKRTVSFIVTLAILVYLVSSIGHQLQVQEEKHNKALKKLKKKDHVKNEYVLRVTHDIKGHLAAIQSNLSVINSRILGPIEKKYEDFIERAYKRTFIANHFIRDLLKITKLRMHDKLEEDTFPLNKILTNAINHVRTNAEAKSISLKPKIEDNLGYINGDEFSIQEITGNLILNAIKYTPPNGSITLYATKIKDKVKISIKDTGVGIPKDEIQFIFDEFYRASNVKKVVEDGTGLGLTIVKKVIERHKGTIWVESEEGKGSVFIYTLPLVTT